MSEHTSKDAILREIESHQEKIARLRKLLNSMEVVGYDWKNETLEQRMYVEWFADKVEAGLFEPEYIPRNER